MVDPSARGEREGAVDLPPGVALISLQTHADSRGDLTELYRASWQLGECPTQWNLTRARANSLRGVHVHRLHSDTVIVLAGEMFLGLQDLRPARLEDGVAAVVRLRSDAPHLVTIPPGVAHGFCFTEVCSVIVGATHEFDGMDEIACHWADPGLRLDWPVSDPELSARDRAAGSLAAMLLSLSD